MNICKYLKMFFKSFDYFGATIQFRFKNQKISFNNIRNNFFIIYYYFLYLYIYKYSSFSSKKIYEYYILQ